jgi:large subunit ribosomal protein L22
MTATKTNERPGTRAQVKNVRMSATKARVVLDLVRGKPVAEAVDLLTYTERAAAEVIGKCLDSAVANAEHNDQIDPETLFVAACYADEGRTLYRWRPRARGRATRIRKRTCHITMIVSPMPAEMLARAQAKREAIPGSRAARRRGQEAASRSERVARSQGAADAAEDEEIVDQDAEAVAVADEAIEADAEVSTADYDESELTESLEDEGIVDQNAEAAVQAAEVTEASEEDTETEGPAVEEPSEPSASEAVDDDVQEGSVQRDSEDSEADEESK